LVSLDDQGELVAVGVAVALVGAGDERGDPDIVVVSGTYLETKRKESTATTMNNTTRKAIGVLSISKNLLAWIPPFVFCPPACSKVKAGKAPNPCTTSPRVG